MLASVAAWPVQFNMRLLGLHIYASQVCAETALTCRISCVEGRRATRFKPGRALRESRLLAQVRAGRRDLK